MKPLKQIVLTLVLTCVFMLGAIVPGSAEVLEKSDQWKSFLSLYGVAAGDDRGREGQRAGSRHRP